MKLQVVTMLFFCFAFGVFPKGRIPISDCHTELNASTDTIQDSLKNRLHCLLKQAENLKYPSYYGGAYIDNDKVVLLLSDSIGYGSLLSMTQNRSFLQIKPCLYSYQELLRIYGVLDDFFFKSSHREMVEKKIGWSSFYLSIPDNRILVRLNKCNERSMALFKKHVIDSPVLLFVQADRYIHITTDISLISVR